MPIQLSASVHLDAESRVRVRDIASTTYPILVTVDGGPLSGGDVNIFFRSPQQLTELITKATDYLANRFAMAPEVEAVA